MIFQIDLQRNPQVGDLIADMNMGDSVAFRTSLKSKSDKLAEFTLEKAMETPKEMMDDEEGEGTDAEENSDGEESDNAKMPAPTGSQNTPGGSAEQDKMAAALTAQI